MNATDNGRTCEYCGDLYEPHSTAERVQRYCSKECRKLAARERSQRRDPATALLVAAVGDGAYAEFEAAVSVAEEPAEAFDPYELNFLWENEPRRWKLALEVLKQARAAMLREEPEPGQPHTDLIAAEEEFIEQAQELQRACERETKRARRSIRNYSERMAEHYREVAQGLAETRRQYGEGVDEAT